jgi:hypothetical protein
MLVVKWTIEVEGDEVMAYPKRDQRHHQKLQHDQNSPGIKEYSKVVCTCSVIGRICFITGKREIVLHPLYTRRDFPSVFRESAELGGRKWSDIIQLIFETIETTSGQSKIYNDMRNPKFLDPS